MVCPNSSCNVFGSAGVNRSRRLGSAEKEFTHSAVEKTLSIVQKISSIGFSSLWTSNHRLEAFLYPTSHFVELPCQLAGRRLRFAS